MADAITQLDRMTLEQEFGRYTPSSSPESLPNIPFVGVPNPAIGGGIQGGMFLEDEILARRQRDDRGFLTGGSIPRSLAEVQNPRFPIFVPGDFNNEDAYAQGQSWTSKMVNAVGKGIGLVGTTFISSTAGLIYGGLKWAEDGKFSSFYNNELTRSLDEFNKHLDNVVLPNYYTDVERDAPWYSSKKLFTANFLFDGIVKNLGFAIGAIYSGGVFAKGVQTLSKGLGMLPGIGKLFSVGKGAEAVAAVESGIAEATAAGKLGKIYGGLKRANDQFLGAYKVLNPAQRAIVAGLATTGEASIEALQNLNQYRDELIQQYKDEHFGEAPTGDVLDTINNEVDRVGNMSFLLNSGLLFITNSIQFPKILGSSYAAEKGIVNDVVRTTGKIVEKEGQYIAKSGGNKILRTLNKIRPYTFSTSEAFEEGSQYAITVGTQDYFNKKYNGERTSIAESIVEGIKGVYGTDEGMQNVLIGGLSGALLLGRSKYKEAREISANTQAAVSKFNERRLSNFTKETFDAVSRGVQLQKERESALLEGNIIDSKDLEYDYIINYVTPRIKYGRYDLVKSDIATYRELASTEEGFEQLKQEGKALPTDTREAYVTRLNQFEQTAENVKSLYQTLNLRYAGIVDEKGNAKYSPVVIDKMVYAASKIADYDQRITSLSPKLLGATIDVGQVMSDLVQGKVEKFNEAVEKIKNLNVIDEEKTTLGEALNDIGEMTLRRNKFLQEYIEIKNNPEKFNEDIKEEPTETEDTTAGTVKVDATFTNKKGAVQNIEIGREYETERVKGVVIKVTEGKFNILDSDGNIISTHNTKDEAVAEVENINRELYNLHKVKVLDINEDGTVKIEDAAGNIQNIQSALFNGYTGLKTQAEILAEQREKIDKEQRDIENTSGSIGTVNPEEIGQESIEEGKLKDVSELFSSGVSRSQDWYDIKDFRPHELRTIEFLNNAKNFKNRENLRAILVTPKQEKELGLEGLAALSYGEVDMSKSEDIDVGFVAQVFVVNEKGKLYFIDEQGNRIGKVGDSVDINRVVFQTMPTTELYWNKPNADGTFTSIPRYRKEQKEQAYESAKAWRALRESLFKSGIKVKPYRFHISRGVAVTTKVDGKFVRSHIGDHLVPENKISTQEGLIEIVKNKTVTHQGRNLGFNDGLVVIKYGDTLETLSNTRFSDDKSNTIYQVIKALADELIATNSINKNYSNFLKSVLFWKSKPGTTSGNQIYIDTAKGEIVLGKNRYAVNDIANKEEEIVNQLKDTFHNVNGDNLKDFRKKFVEYRWENGKLSTTEWTNYQIYLLASKNPDGSNRGINETPLLTNVAKPGDGVPYSFKQKYSTLEDFDLVVPPSATEKPTPIPTPVNTIGGYKVDGSVNDYVIVTKDESKLTVQFTAVIKDGEVDVTINPSQETVTKVAANQGFVTSISGKLHNVYKAQGKEEALANITDPIDIVNLYFKIRIEGELKSKKEEKPEEKLSEPKAEEQKPVDIEARKADIENRRKKELYEFPSLEIGSTFSRKPNWTDEFHEETVFAKSKDGKAVLTGKTKEDATWKKIKDFVGDVLQISDKDKNKINIKYDAELAALEGKKDSYNPKNTNPKKRFTRLIEEGEEKQGRLTQSEIEAYRKWADDNIPMFPVEVLDRIIEISPTEKAWGVFEDNTIKFYRGAIKGVQYHEAFEAVWNSLLSPEQQEAILAEERPKNIGKSDSHIKEKMADDFGRFKEGKLKASSLSERILNFFRSIIEFFTTFGRKPSLKKQLFEAIDSGKFKEAEIINRNIGPQYSKIGNLSEAQTYEFVQDMLGYTADLIFSNDDKDTLFSPNKMTSKEIFDVIKQFYIEDGKYDEMGGETTYQALVTRTKEALIPLGIRFNEEDVVDINDEEATNRNYSPEAFSTDWKKYSPFAVKIVGSTLPMRKPLNQTLSDGLEIPDREESGVLGNRLVNFSRIFSVTMSKISNTTDVDKIAEKMFQLAKEDADFITWFQRIGGSINTGEFDFANFKKSSDWRFFINFFQTFTKQHPEALTQYISGNEVYTGTSDLFAAAMQMKRQWLQRLKSLSQDGNSIIVYDRASKSYKVNMQKFPSTPKRIDDILSFLDNLGIEFSKDAYKKLKTQKRKGEKKSQQDSFLEAVGAIYTHIQKNNDIATISGETLDVGGHLNTISELYIKVTNPIHENTHYNAEGSRVQNYAENNVPSIFENEFNGSETLGELKEIRPELNDVFSQSSVTLMKGGLFIDKDGNRIKSIKIGHIEGQKILDGDKGTHVVKLSRGDRFALELNQNLNGKYYILVPADSATEWVINLGNYIGYDETDSRKVLKVFRGYLNDEIALAKDYENRGKLLNIGNKARELRFFKEILSERVLAGINNLLAKDASTEDINEYIDKHIDTINKDIKAFIDNTVENTKQTFLSTGKIVQINSEEGIRYSFSSLDSTFTTRNDVQVNKFDLSEEQLNKILLFADTNYIINNIEMHKILFGDPYQFKTDKGKLDETKRIKSFLSPRRITFDHPAFNTFLNEEYNTIDGTELEDGELGKHKFSSYIRTATSADVNLATEIYSKINEADGSSIIMDGYFREVKLKNGQWTPEAEQWYQWQMAYTRRNLPGYRYKNKDLIEHDIALLKTEEPVYVLDVLKPIVTGTVANSTSIITVLDKFSQMPLFYKAVEGTNLAKLYEKMWKEDIGYVVMESGRKVGATSLNSLYKENGEFNDSPFEGIVEVPWKAYGIQVENSYEKEKEQTRGSQLVKLSSLDLFSYGEPVSEEAKKQYDRNVKALKLLHENGYKRVLNKLGIKDLGTHYELVDTKAVQDTLEHELLRRELSQNDRDTLKRDESGRFIIPFEASTSYKKIQSILYSIVNKQLVSPKMNGGPKVQVPVTLWENSGVGRGMTEVNGKKVYTASTLKFYENKDGKRYCEVMLPNWFKDRINKNRFRTDKELIEYLNNSRDGQEILTGIGFRIPTQAMSSIEIFRVKEFLPAFMGDTIVVPSEITAKAGSDFDIDKLNTYLKSIYIDKRGDIRLIRYQGSEEETREFFKNVYIETLGSNIEKLLNNPSTKDKVATILNKMETIPEEGIEDIKDIFSLTPEEWRFYNDNVDTFNEIIEQSDVDNINPSEYVKSYTLSADIVREKYIDKMYQRSLENEYYDSLEKMMIVPENFDRLVHAIDDAGLEALSVRIEKLRGDEEELTKNRLLSRTYMTGLRHAFATAKKWVGIVATNITGHSNAQKSKVYIDTNRFKDVSEFDRSFLGDGEIALPHNTVNVNGKEYASLSGMYTKDSEDKEKKEYISDRLSGYATSVVDAPKNPYILKLIPSDKVVSVFLFLERLGVGERSVLFLNQPIIREYLNYIEIKGKGLFSKGTIEDFKNNYGGKRTKTFDSSISALENNIKDGSTLTKEQRNEQLAIFDEFLKYAKMDKFLFKLSQATNYDTTKFKNGAAFNRKKTRTTVARKANIFSSVDNMLDSTFMGDHIGFLDKAMSSIGAIMKTERTEFTDVLEPIIEPYEEQEYMSNDDFDVVSDKLKASFLDYIIQTKTNLDGKIKSLLVDGSTSVATQLEEARRRHPDMLILKHLQVESPDRGVDSTKTIKLFVNLKSAYDEDVYVGMMRELKEVELTLYNNLVKVSILQGVYQSAVSIKNIIPVEDYSAEVRDIFDTLTVTKEVRDFADGWFQKNNWRDNNVVPDVEIKFFTPWQAGEQIPMLVGVDQFENEIYQYTSPSFDFKIRGEKETLLTKLGLNAKDRRVLLLNEKYNSDAVAHEFIKIRRIQKSDTGDNVNFTTGRTISPSEYAAKRKRGDKSLYDIFGYRQVRYADGTPVVTKKGEYVYKLTNLMGDGQYATEYYNEHKPSVLNNGTVKIENEIPDTDIISAFEPMLRENIITENIKKEELLEDYSQKTGKVLGEEREYTPENITSLKSNEIFVFGSNTEGRHGKGAAKTAKDKFGAKYGQAEGLQGQSYAIITKDLSRGEKSIPLQSSLREPISIGLGIEHFLRFAIDHPELKFYVTKLGSSLAGYSVEQIRSVFKNALHGIPDNVILPKEYEVRENNIQVNPLEVEGINISSYESGLGGQLSNFAKLPITFRGKSYNSSEAAYQANKKDLSDNSVKELMIAVLIAKLTQHPNLLEDIRNRGGIDFLNNSSHNLVKEGRTIKQDRWTGENGLFMQSLRQAYNSIVNVGKDFNSLTEFSPERKTEIINNFVEKHKMTEQQALNYINDALLRDRDNVIELLKKCY